MLDFEKIRRLREKAGLTLQSAADKAGLTDRQAWHRIESGTRINVTIATLESVAKALGVRAKDLLR